VLEADAETMSKAQTLSYARMVLITGGCGTFCFDDTELDFKAGDLLFGFAGEIIRVKEPQKASFIYIDFGGSRATELLRRFNINRATRTFDSFDGLIPMWRESLSRASEQTVDLAAESILLYTFSRLTGALNEKNGLIGKMIEITEEHFKEPSLSLSEAAKMLSYNPKYVSHLFKDKMGVSYSEYLRSIRIKYAITLFDHGIDSIKNVALLSGFTDPLYFSNVFKKQIGVSPKEYIQGKTK
jgi:AraC-like DNA-binding protein